MILAALVIGFVSSIHCVGMCGPLAMLINGKNRRTILVNRLVYNAGRIITYGVLGLGVGLFGEQIALKGWQQALSIVAGIFILAMLLFPRIERFLTPRVSGIIHVLKQNLSRVIRQPSGITVFSTGLLNGLLPCGMVYLALAMAAAQGDTLMGTYFMLAFGAGTIPAMLTVAYAGQLVRKMTPSWRIIQVSFFVILAVILIGRGFVAGDHQGHLLGNEDVTQCE